MRAVYQETPSRDIVFTAGDFWACFGAYSSEHVEDIRQAMRGITLANVPRWAQIIPEEKWMEPLNKSNKKEEEDEWIMEYLAVQICTGLEEGATDR